ncbi:MAG: winged helix-turn-helix domain-containing protein [Candidatus Micrarchaeota archaeon]|nr:winged helix-turn-helix domain-containing protein [Candidatus Micrarchaeota archaeon]
MPKHKSAKELTNPMSDDTHIRNTIEQLCINLDLLTGRDTEKTLIQLLSAIAKEKKPFGTTELSQKTGINRVTCIHHIRKLQIAGLIVKRNNFYELNDLEEFYKFYKQMMQKRLQMLEKLIKELEEL